MVNERSQILNGLYFSEAFMASFIGLFTFTRPVVHRSELRS